MDDFTQGAIGLSLATVIDAINRSYELALKAGEKDFLPALREARAKIESLLPLLKD